MTGRLICLRMLDGPNDGVWIAVEPGAQPSAVWDNGVKIDLVATGTVEWNGDQPAEVFVPVARFDEYRTEFDIEDR